MSKKPLALDSYEKLAEVYATQVDARAQNAYYERPATLSLLPDTQGKRVLDAGCGPGVYSEWLVGHGARVVACDASPRMVEFARKRLGTKVTVLQVDLEQPLDMWNAAAFDLVLSALVIDHVRDWDKLFGEFHRLLSPGGYLVFSVGHPFTEYQLHGKGSYFDKELLDFEWKAFGIPVRVPYYRRPLEMLVNSLLGAGFWLDRLLEARPTEQFKQAAPEDYEELMRRPGFLCVRALKR